MNCGRRIYVFLAVLQGEVDVAGDLAELPRSPRLAAWIKLVRLYLPIGQVSWGIGVGRDRGIHDPAKRGSFCMGIHQSKETDLRNHPRPFSSLAHPQASFQVRD